jgi:acetyltransferase
MSAELTYFFNPRSIAVVGASKNMMKIGARIFNHLTIGKYGGKIYPINPNESEIFGYKTFANVKDVPDEVDVAVITLPANLVPQVVQDCIDKKVKYAVIITSGFKEAVGAGPNGVKLQEEVVRIAKGKVRLVGPNCMGYFNTSLSLFPILMPTFPKKGGVSMVSQSGGIGGVVVEYVMTRGVGCSKFVSSGNEADLHFEDFLEYLIKDEETKVILAFVEGLREGRRFFELAKNSKKPIVVLKAGTTGFGKRAAISHTSAITGAEEAYDAAFRQANVVRVKTIGELVEMGAAFAAQPLPKGRRVCVITSGGGAGVISADMCAENGLELPKLPDEVVAELDGYLPGFWSRNNPVDITAGAARDFSVFAKCVEALLKCSEIDGIILALLVGMFHKLPTRYKGIVSQEKMKELAKTQEFVYGMELDLSKKLAKIARVYGKPIVSVNPMAPYTNHDEKMEKIIFTMVEGGISTHPTPEDAIKVYRRMVEWVEGGSKPS